MTTAPSIGNRFTRQIDENSSDQNCATLAFATQALRNLTRHSHMIERSARV